MMFDIVICSNRPELLEEQYVRTSAFFPDHKIIIIIPKSGMLHGEFRNRGSSLVTSPFFLMLDDDIRYTEEDVVHMQNYHIMRKGLFAINARITFTDDKGLQRAQRMEPPGVAGGFCMYNTAYFKKIGGFNSKIGVGEDKNLYDRATKIGYEWVRDPDLNVLHKGSLLDFITRRGRHLNPHGELLRRFIGALRQLIKRTVKLRRHEFRVIALMMMYDTINMVGAVRSLGARK